MNLKKYFEIQSLDGATSRSSYAKVVLAVHTLNSQGAKLVVDWPKWASAANYFGTTMRVFGTEDELLQVKKIVEAHVAKILRGKYGKKPMLLGPVLDVPEHAKVTWIFKRDRAPCRLRSNSLVQRLQRRALARGEQPKEYEPKFVEAHTLMLMSLSTELRFPMDICRARPNHLDFVDCEPSSYGLGVPIPRF
ncbi:MULTISPECIES: type I-F CRISPR-associated endoribonuclease Cas6/Csy4 [Pseudomonas]|uniref:type I-F CRISPR-associated endoribonuclease Cas6/Csy4 n=1 Tax=Pseudomonas TaxID=286 RepID=UPI001473E87B|nr:MULTISPECIES: type I-F CRISPR-associated endoribonuclease Cas6/Csy4 [Pseudomonas]MEC4242055.1 type I-F CRISPR-associated endoribonuclease Cas6/Csy4 [Pseudomonas sp. DSV-1]NNB33991.1 type I-F CRISPR-associated endoribonuclease Cas6/Csy4 [Pseudomonas fragi]